MILGAHDIGRAQGVRYLVPGFADQAIVVSIGFDVSAGTLSTLRVRHNQPHDSDETTITYVLRKNTFDTDMSVTMQASQSSGFDDQHPVACSDGDRLELKVIKNGLLADGSLDVVVTID